MDERIAIVGMEASFGTCRTKEDCWASLLGNRPTVAPSTRLLPTALSSAAYQKTADAVVNFRVSEAVHVREEHGSEAAFLLHLTRRALVDAGYGGSKVPRRCGLVAGLLSFPTEETAERLQPTYEAMMRETTGVDTTADVSDDGPRRPGPASAAPVSHTTTPADYCAAHLGLDSGVVLSLDAACASALYCLDVAKRYLLSGKVDAMLCGASTFAHPIFVLTGFSTFRALPLGDGVSAPFDTSTVGLTPGEGGAMYVLKRYGDAVRAGDRIHGVLSGVHVDNAGKGLPLKPDKVAEERCLRETYRRSQIDPSTVQYVECHATGTVQGDAAELRALEATFGGKLPPVGSSKGNFGHCLVSAGFAGLLKVIMAMKTGTIPATPCVQEAVDAAVVTTNRPWPTLAAGQTVLRAGLSAFGFGGTNAHAIIDAPAATMNVTPTWQAPTETRSPVLPAMDIVGMDCHFGTCESLEAYDRLLRDGGHAMGDLPSKRWRSFNTETMRRALGPGTSGAPPRGCFVAGYDLDFKEYRMSMKEDDIFIDQQLMAIRSMDRALRDAGAEVGGHVAVLVGLGTDMHMYAHCERVRVLQQLHDTLDSATMAQVKHYLCDTYSSMSYCSMIGNLIATRLSAKWRLTGPSFSVTDGVHSVNRCLELAQLLLTDASITAVVVAGVDMAGHYENMRLHASRGVTWDLHGERPSARLGGDAARGVSVGEGAGAVVLRRASDAAAVPRAYARVAAVVSGRDAADSATRALAAADVAAGDVGSLEMTMSPGLDETHASLGGLADVYALGHGDSGERYCALGAAETTVGHCGYAAGMASLIKSALALHRRYLPGTPGWDACGDADAMERSGMYVSTATRTWHRGSARKRVAAIASGERVHVLLREVARPVVSEETKGAAVATMPALAAVSGASLEELRRRVRERCFVTNRDDLCVDGWTVVFTDPATTREDVESFETYLAGPDVEQGRAWTGASGSYFTPRPLRSDRVAFVYGDAAMPYGGMGRDLFEAFPALHDHVETDVPDMWDTASDVAWMPKETRAAAEATQLTAFTQQHGHKLRAGVWHGCVQTTLATEVLGLRPGAALGLSMGEVTMLFAFSRENKARSAEVLRRQMRSDVWTRDTTGEFRMLRRAWGIADDVPVDRFWSAYLVPLSHERALEAARRMERVRVMIVHSDAAVIIAGLPEQCRRLSRVLLPLPQTMCGHCPEAEAVSDDIREIYEPLTVPESPLLFTTTNPTGCWSPGSRVGEALGRMYASTADFPKMYRMARDSGYDVFVEVGTRNHRTDAIRSMSRGEAVVAVALDGNGGLAQTPVRSVLAAVAQLCSHGVAMPRLRFQVPCLETPALPRTTRRLCPHFRYRPMDRSTLPLPLPSPVASPERVKDVARTLDHTKIATTTTTTMASMHFESSTTDGDDAGDADSHRSNPVVLWDEQALLEFAEGDIAKVFGPEYGIIDTYEKRVRLPMRDYLLVSRVTHMSATTHEYKPSTMTTEYDLPVNGPFSEGGDIPWAILVESGQCDLMLISYLGVDFQCKGKRGYRLLDTTLTFFGVAREGQTLKYDISINGYAKGGDGEIKMFFFSYNCYVDGKLLIEMRNGVAGFFTDEELEAGNGVIHTAKELAAKASAPRYSVEPFRHRRCDRRSFDEASMARLCEGCWGDVMGAPYDDVTYRLCTRKILMIDRVTHVIPDGGTHGLGMVVGEKDLARDHWYFPCHFMDDQVMAGSLVSDGCSQLLKLYMVWLGLHTEVGDYKFRPVPGQGQKVRCRGQIAPHRGKLVYCMDIKEVGRSPQGYPYIKADVDIIDVDYEKGQTFDLAHLAEYGRGDRTKKIVVDFKNIALQLEGDVNTPATQLWWHPLAGVQGNPTPSFVPTALQPRAIQFAPFPGNPLDQDHTPGEFPLSWYNICEFQYGKLANCFGPAFDRYDHGSTASRMPGFELAMLTRILDVTNRDQPAKATMTSEFDCPRDAWFFQRKNHVAPYCIIMEMGLQTAGFLSAITTALKNDDADALFRNLDCKAEMLKEVDMRGKTITNRTRATAFSKMGTMMIHSFHFELLVDGEVFYRGDTSFGWFEPKTFQKQVGLDKGKPKPTWLEAHAADVGAVDVVLERDQSAFGLFSDVGNPNTHGQLHHRDQRLEQLVDTTQLLLHKGGLHGQGYAHGHRVIDPQDWFFSCHFWCDPVMPGSLGVEAMYGMLEDWCMKRDLAGAMGKPRFVNDPGKTTWKYRGQLVRTNKRMDVEIHVKEVVVTPTRVTVIADGDLYVDRLRVYKVHDLRCAIEDTRPGAKKPVTSRPGEYTHVPVVRDPSPGCDETKSRDPSKSTATTKAPGTPPVTAMTTSTAGGSRPADTTSFESFYGVRLPVYSGAMAKGIASADLVIAMGKARLLGSFGAGGLPMHLVEEGLDRIQAALPEGPYAVNLIHSPFDDILESDNVELFLRRGVRVVEASAFMELTRHVVRYRVAGLSRGADGSVCVGNKVIAKLSRTELAAMFMRPAPPKLLRQLVADGHVTAEQADLAAQVPMCDDVVVESDSGGHTDNRPLHVLLPLILHQRDAVMDEHRYAHRIRVGAAGGIGCPEAVRAAFSMGADFVVTGTVNQMSRESGSCDYVRKQLSEATYSDVTMAPAADMFDQGVQLQVLKKGVLFPVRAKKLYHLYKTYGDLDAIPAKDRRILETQFFQQSIDDVWAETKAFYTDRLKSPDKVAKAEHTPKLKMSMVFRWYLSKSSNWANRGIAGRERDYQVWCGPAIGSFNDFIRGTPLDPKVSGSYPSVVDINHALLQDHAA